MNLRRMGPVFLAFVLSILPILIFSRELQQKSLRNNDEVRRSWVRSTTFLARQFEEMCQPAFWVRESSRRLRRALELASGHDRATVVSHLTTDLRSHLPRGIVVPRVYAYFHGDPDRASPGEFLTGAGFQSSYKFLFSRLFNHLGQTVRNAEQRSAQGDEIIRQITGILGGSLPAGVFNPESRGMCFPIFFERKFRLATWDTVSKNGKPVVTYLLLFPNGPHAYRDAIRLALREFPRYAPEARSFPIVLPLRTPVSKKGWSISSSRPHLPRQVVSLCGTIRREMVVRRPGRKPRTLVPLEDQFSKPVIGGFPGPLSSVDPFPIWDVRLPVHRMIAPVEKGGWWGLLAPLHPCTTSVAVFVEPAPSDVLPDASLPQSLLIGVFLLWGIWGAAIATGRKPIFLGIRSMLVIWVLGLALAPICIIWGSSDRMFNAVRLNQLQFLESELKERLETIENRFMTKRNEWLSVCRSYLSAPFLTRDLDVSNLQAPGNMKVLEGIMQSLHRKGIHPQLIMVSTSSKDTLSWYDSALSPTERTGLRDLFKLILDELCISLQMRRQSGTETRDLLQGNRSSLSNQNNLTGNECLTKTDSIYESQLGTRRTLSYYNFFRTEKGDEGSFLILWGEESHYGEFLQKEFSQRVGSLTTDSIAVFRTVPEPTLVQSQGDPAVIERIARQLRSNRFDMNPQDGFQRRAFLFSTKLPGHLFVASRSMHPILRQIRSERERIVLIIFLLLMIGLLGTIPLGTRIHDPIITMTDGLRKISEGNLGVSLPDERQDETGVAGRDLNQMTAWLKERLNLSRFVSSDVLSTVAGGQLENLVQANRRNAVILVTDIRGFTTLSETHPPDTIFRMINRHLQGMTRIIRSYHGTIDRFIGDAIQVVFDDSTLKNPSRSAVCAALAMMEEHERINGMRREEGLFPYAIGIGIERGDIVSGVLGDPSVRLDFTVLGDPVREAAELEAASKNGTGTRIICSKRIQEELSAEFEFNPVPGSLPGQAWELCKPRCDTSPEIPAGVSLASSKHSLRRPEMHALSAAENDPRPGMHDWKGPASILAGFLVILFLALSGITSIDRSITETLGKQTRLEIRREFGVLERINEPRFQIAQCIQKRIDSGIATWSTTALEAILPSALSGIGSATWAVLHLPQALSEDLEIGQVFERTLMRVGESGFPLADGLTRTLYLGILRRYSPRSLSAKTCAWLDSQDLRAVHDGHQILGISEIDHTGYRSPVPIRIDGRDHILFWTSSLSLAPHAPSFPVAMVIFPIEACTFSAGHRAFVENQTKNDRSVALVPCSQDNEATHASGVFISRPEFRSLFAREVSGEIIESGGERWEVHSSVHLREQAYRLYMARKIPAAPFRAPEWRKGVLALVGLSAALALALVLRSRYLGIPIQVGLRGQMVGVLLLMVIPLAMQGVVFIERADLEETVWRKNQRSADNIELLTTVEQSKTLFDGYQFGLVEGLLNSPRVMRELLIREAKREKTGPKPLADLLRRMQLFLLEHGGAIGPCILGGSSFVVTHKHIGEVSRSELLRARIFNAPYAKIIQQFAHDADAKPESKDLLVTLGEVTINEIANPMASPITLAEIWLGRQVLYSLVFSGRSEAPVSIRLFLFDQGVPRFSFRAQLDYPGNRYFLLNTWQNRLRDENTGQYLFNVHRQFPNIGMSEPFCVFKHVGDGFGYWEAYSFLFPGIAEAVSEAFLSGSPRSEVLDFQGQRNLVSIAPEASGAPFALALVSDLEVIESPFRAQREAKRWGMLGLLLFCILGARLIAAIFLGPLLALSEGARAVRNGDLDLRLDENEPGEFRFLAESFNFMADGVREGSLLSRFVSDSVREAARTRVTLDGGDQGEHQRLTVLFAGLSNFKSLLAEGSPERLFTDLNRYLEAMSGVIRQHDGDIDKFIGDKILAVFRDTTASPQGSAERAVAAAIAMKRRFSQFESEIHSPLGIGIVTGPVIAGILGTAEVRLEYTVLGDTVNLASRLSDLAQKLDSAGGIFIESTTCQDIGDLITRRGLSIRNLDLPPIKGKTRSIEGFALEWDSLSS